MGEGLSGHLARQSMVLYRLLPRTIHQVSNGLRETWPGLAAEIVTVRGPFECPLWVRSGQSATPAQWPLRANSGHRRTWTATA